MQEIGSKATPVKGSCPAQPCSVMTKMTAYQGRAGAVKNPYVIRHAGYIVAFTVALGKPNATQTTFFQNGFGQPSQLQPPQRALPAQIPDQLVQRMAVGDLALAVGAEEDDAARRG